MTRPDGQWEQYTYDEQGRQTSVVRPYFSSVPGEGETTEVTNITYSVTNPVETRVTTISNQEVRRSFTVETDDGDEFERSTITATVPGAAWNDSSNLVSSSRSYTSSHANPLLRGRTKSSTRTDGSQSIHGYAQSGGDLVETVTEIGTDSVAHTVTKRVFNGNGVQTEEEVRDVASDLLVNWWEAVGFDSHGRATAIEYQDGTTLTHAYVGSSGGCGSCSSSASQGLVASETDRTGITTTYTYDALGRRISATRLGIRQEWDYDAADRVLEHRRVGTDDSEITLAATTYDLAGRTVSTLDALGNETTYTYVYPVGGGMTTTVTHPDGGTVVRTTWPGGDAKETGGTAAAPMKSQRGVWAGGNGTARSASARAAAKPNGCNPSPTSPGAPSAPSSRTHPSRPWPMIPSVGLKPAPTRTASSPPWSTIPAAASPPGPSPPAPPTNAARKWNTGSPPRTPPPWSA